MNSRLDSRLLARCVDVAHQLADIGGDIQRRKFRTQVTVETKPDGSPVTEVDKETETALRELIEQAFPDHGIVGEEFGRLNENAELVWILDPIDGTKSFLTGLPMFGILIALVYQGKFILGVIDQPILQDRWIGADGLGTKFNGMPVRTRPCASLANAVLCIDGPSRTPTEEDRRIANVRRQCRWVRYGSHSYVYGLLASGYMDLVIDTGLDCYDFAALEPVVRNAGGTLTDWEGKRLTMNSDGRLIAAGDPNLGRDVLRALSRNDTQVQ